MFKGIVMKSFWRILNISIAQMNHLECIHVCFYNMVQLIEMLPLLVIRTF